MAFGIAWWLPVGVSALLAVLCGLLFIDARGQRKALARLQEQGAALQARVAQQEAAIGRLTSAFAPLALVEDTSQRSALAPAQPRTDPVPPTSAVRARDVAHVVPIEEPRALVMPDKTREARLRLLLRSRPFPDGTTLAESMRQKFHGILDEERYPNVRHCQGPTCCPGAWDVCACPCATCNARRYALTLTQRLFRAHVPFDRLPGEKPEAWALRVALAEQTYDAPSLVTEGEASLTPEDLARVDAFAAKRGITRQEAIKVCLLAFRPANDVPGHGEGD